MGWEGRNVSQLELQDLVTRCGVRRGKGECCANDLVSRLRRMVGSLMRPPLSDKGVVGEPCAWPH